MMNSSDLLPFVANTTFSLANSSTTSLPVRPTPFPNYNPEASWVIIGLLCTGVVLIIMGVFCCGRNQQTDNNPQLSALRNLFNNRQRNVSGMRMPLAQHDYASINNP